MKTGEAVKKTTVATVVPNNLNKLIAPTRPIVQMKMSLFSGNPYYKPGSLAAGGVRNAGTKGRRT